MNTHTHIRTHTRTYAHTHDPGYHNQRFQHGFNDDEFQYHNELMIDLANLDRSWVVRHAGRNGDKDGDDGVDAFVKQRHGGGAMDQVRQRIDQLLP